MLMLATVISLTLPTLYADDRPLPPLVALAAHVYHADGTRLGTGFGFPGDRISVTVEPGCGVFYATAVRLDKGIESEPSDPVRKGCGCIGCH